MLIFTYIDDEHLAVGIVALDKRMGQRTLFMIFQERYPSGTAVTRKAKLSLTKDGSLLAKPKS
ncbi:MAG TPA: hypothetical protein VFH06_00385 [Candidatus Saccharimonadales bacterium]|nr:hypothetical protein [Candidatus Saccharimonadales bacterium]